MRGWRLIFVDVVLLTCYRDDRFDQLEELRFHPYLFREDSRPEMST